MSLQSVSDAPFHQSVLSILDTSLYGDPEGTVGILSNSPTLGLLLIGLGVEPDTMGMLVVILGSSNLGTLGVASGENAPGICGESDSPGNCILGAFGVAAGNWILGALGVAPGN
jgi:hypothetical protein